MNCTVGFPCARRLASEVNQLQGWMVQSAADGHLLGRKQHATKFDAFTASSQWESLAALLYSSEGHNKRFNM